MEDNIKGLTYEEVCERIKEKKQNIGNNVKTKSIKEIILGNVFTYFNILNIFLGLTIIIVGIIGNELLYSLKNCLFLGVVVTNTLISIYQEISSKKTIDKLSKLTSIKPEVVRDGKTIKIENEQIVLDDVLKLNIGSQITTDSEVIYGLIEVNESFLTGESNTITKKKGDKLLSGSFVVSGYAYAKVTSVGNNNYLNTIVNSTKSIERNKSVIFNSFEKLIKLLSYVIIPFGIIVFVNQYFIVHLELMDAIINTVAALIGMIPEGLVLLTSSVMAVSVIRLSKYKVLIQQLYCIETLARVNVICLDKTGTLTTGKMKLAEIISKNNEKNKFEEIIKKVIGHLPDNSGTIKAVRSYFKIEPNNLYQEIIPFSSERKYSACYFDSKTYYIGSPEYVLLNTKIKIDEDIKKKQNDYRVLVIASSKEKLNKKPTKLEIEGYLFISDEIRSDAKDTLNFFKEQNVKVKIISGDSIRTVLKISNDVGLENIKGIDLVDINMNNLDNLVKENDAFGRVTPYNKQKIVESLKKNGYIVAMTGDGVNDVLALKEADCSISVASGHDAAKNVSQLVLLDSNFSSMPKIVAEGRRTINNIERSAALLLVKTIYTFLLMIICLILRIEYFFIPIQLTLMTAFTIGIPSFVLALFPNKEVINNKNFLLKIIMNSLPGSLTVFLNIIILLIFKSIYHIDSDLFNTMCVYSTAITSFIHLFQISKPFNIIKRILFITMIGCFSLLAVIKNDFFSLAIINKEFILIIILLMILSIIVYFYLKKIVNNTFNKISKN